MFFYPHEDERAVIMGIRNFTNDDYAIIRLTKTMVVKCTIDANENFRQVVEEAGLADYRQIANGQKEFIKAIFIGHEEAKEIDLSLYRVNNDRGDRRFSIKGSGQMLSNHELEIGDLLYFFSHKMQDGSYQLFVVNTTHNTPSDALMREVFGLDETATALEELRPRLAEVLNGGPYENSKGAGKIAPKDAGDTFEALMGIRTNNDAGADYKGLIEFKTKRAKTMDTLFTLRPSFEGTPIAAYEANDRNRVSAFARYYGYESDNHPDMKSLYITIAIKGASRNNQGFFLKNNYDERRVELMHTENGQDVVTAYWNFADLRRELMHKHPATLWIDTEIVREGTADTPALFSYKQVSFSRSPQFTTFLNLIDEGRISYDWRGYTTPEGKYQGKNHGNAWRITAKFKNMLFDSLEVLEV